MCNELLDRIDYHFYKLKCRNVEELMPRFMKMEESEPEGDES